MESLTSRQKKALETREKLLKTSLDLFNKYGFEHVSVEQITKACNVSKGTFYTHFPSKYDVILEKFMELDQFYSTVEKNIDPSLSASEKILFVYQQQMNYLTKVVGKDLLRTVYTAAMTNQVEQDHYLINPQRKIFQIMNTYIEEGIRQGEFRQDVSAPNIQAIIRRCMRANVYDWLIHSEDFDLASEMAQFTTIVLDGLKSHK
ncbi:MULTISPECIES: TetR/AcrR family transcriptional regulator [Lysinibacillus]|jgi:AcrR family transcriptional regulator|uniref:TetR/AcrR family transcriptional regulator n=1 Tax=Lysinibacillus fusiformis TaxID=28031 RepID=A0A2I0V5D1_9BACI|nr:MULTISPECIES: TetR/AcrR family transcriptional regulator [Lysinibacillus]KUF36252.1 TetR family transcriptional regulator [Lysinibacillus sp. F5]MEE3806786.1 TetR/AcrR family transcriptional regulator [Lysinibacillus fusiformis]PKU53488.1 TetR/AcrR family transcriptional regulator [Lysinibacillus fusiformis]WCH48553.1 TetR/AcrR family transcriptional regulator [Lysinibacillus sp. OF-1]SCX76855.1 transcriptional regulator, TetR family [Lysinibacillus sp. SG9]